MAKQQIWDNPIDKNVDWGGDASTNHLPVSGARVQEFIKGTFDKKYGYARALNNKAQFFASELEADLYDSDAQTYARLLLSEFPLPKGGGGSTSTERVVLESISETTFAISPGKQCLIKFKFRSQVRNSSSEDYTDIREAGIGQVQKLDEDNNAVVISNFKCVSGDEVIIDITDHLAKGDNTIYVNVTGQVTGNAPTVPLMYFITLTNLSLNASVFEWWKPFNSDIVVPFYIGGDVEKVLYTKVKYNGELIHDYERELGKKTYTDNTYNVTIPRPSVPGVYNISAQVKNKLGTIQTEMISYNIICVSDNDQNKYVAVNNISSTLTNFSNNNAFEYTVYDGINSITDLIFGLVADSVGYNRDFPENPETGAKQIFNADLEIDTLENSNFELTVQVKDNDTVYHELEFEIDNSSSYSAEEGAVFYMKPGTRSNNQANRTKIVNEMTRSEVSATWKNVSWGGDGWVVDDNGDSVLRLYAGATGTINYKPFTGDDVRNGKTIEVDFCVKNVSNESAPAINITKNNRGLLITPNSVYASSQLAYSQDKQSVNIQDSERIRVTYVISPNSYGITGLNFCYIYINGVKNRTFMYGNNDNFNNDSTIVIGCTDADVDVYGIRVYNRALSSTGVTNNLINWETSTEKRNTIKKKNDLFDIDNVDIDINKVKKLYNVFVFSGDVPSYTNPKVTGTGDLEVMWFEHPEWNSIVRDCLAEGQGTSSKKYFEWNLRWKLSRKVTVDGKEVKIKSSVDYADGSASTTGKWRFLPNYPSIEKATAKLNWASSMQSHKMGSVNSLTDLANAMNIINEAKSRISVYQEPFVGFAKKEVDGEIVYEFLGLYTFGPDKGDDNTFGYDDDKYPTMISVEGADNAPLLALFRIPWNDKVVYDEGEESFQYNNENCWDFNAGDLDNIGSFINAYNFVYECSPRLMPYNGTLAELNEQKDIYKEQGHELWLTRDNDRVVYYDAVDKEFVYSDTGSGPISLSEQLVDKGYSIGKNTLLTSENLNSNVNDRNEQYIAARIDKFRKEMQQYWNLDDSIFYRNWVEFNAATDNRAKNTYPYTFDESYPYRWRGDDMDTIWPINNQGQSAKGYWVEIHDTYDNGGPVWNGETSNFWNLLDLAFPDEVRANMKKFMQTMEELGGISLGNHYDKIYGFFDKYYFKKAQDNFSQTLYNTTAKKLYENAKVAEINGKYTNDTDPITQSLGDHYSAEKRWLSKRIVYMMSKYAYGDFGNEGTGAIIVRAAGNSITYNITPAVWMYPCVASGTSLVQGERTKAGESCTISINLAGSADQQNAILGANYLQDIGEWYDKNVTGPMTVTGKMLTHLRLGHQSKPITISIDQLNISNTPSLKYLMLSRISTLSKSLDLSGCVRLEECYLDGTGINNTTFANGGALKTVVFGTETLYVIFRNMPLLKNSGVNISSCINNITLYSVTGCEQMDPVTMLYNIYKSQERTGVVLRNIRCTDFDEVVEDGVLNMLYAMATGDFFGVDTVGTATNTKPVIEGKLHVNKAEEVMVNRLKDYYPNLEITYDELGAPTGYDINITSKTEFKENETIKLTAQSTIPALYPEIKWSIFRYGNTFVRGTIEINEDTGQITITTPSDNKTFTDKLIVAATSYYNSAIRKQCEITITGTKVTKINVTSGDVVRNGDRLTCELMESNHTKPNKVVWSTDNDNVSVNADTGVVTVSNTAEPLIVKFRATYYYDSTIYTDKWVVVNDAVVADYDTNPELMDLANYYGWSRSGNTLLASELFAVNDATPNIATIFNNSDIVDFEEFKYIGVTKLYKNMFSGCDKLKRLCIPEHITQFDSSYAITSSINMDYLEIRCANMNTSCIRNITANEVVLWKDVSEGSTNNISLRNRLILKEGVTTCPLLWCLNLEYVSIPSTLRKIKGFDCSNRQSITESTTFDISGTNFIVKDGFLMDFDETTIYCVLEQRDDAVIPEYITRLHDYSCTRLGNVYLHENVEYIGKYALSGASVAYVDFIKSANWYSFSNVELKNDNKIVITGNIGDRGLASVKINTPMLEITECNISGDPFYDATVKNDDCEIYIRSNCTFARGGQDPHGSLIDARVMYDGTLSEYLQTPNIGLIVSKSDLYIDNDLITGTVNIPDGVTSISDYAFINSVNVTGVYSAVGIDVMISAFANSSIQIASGINNVGASAFNKSQLKEIYFNNCVTIDDSAFAYSAIESIVIPEGVTILRKTFQSCTLLNSVELPSTISTIEDYTFSSCGLLERLTCKATKAPTVKQRTFGSSYAEYPGVRQNNSKELLVPMNSTGYTSSFWTTLTDVNKSGFVIKNIYDALSCKSLTIFASDVEWFRDTTVIEYTAVTDGYDPCSGSNVYDVVVTGSIISDNFGQNTTNTEKNIELSFTYLDKTKTTTILQGACTEKYYYVDLNGEWRLSRLYTTDNGVYDGVYESFSNIALSNGVSTAYIKVFGYNTFTLLLRYDGEGSYDYVRAECNGTIYKPSEPTTTNDISNYTTFTITGLNPSREETISIIYSKDSSGNSGTDRGYLLILKNQ